MNSLTALLADRISPEATNPEYSMFDDGGIEVETGEFLYSFVRLLRPHHIFESGVYSGISAMYMADGLRDNHLPDCEIFTCDIEQSHIDRAKALWERAGVGSFIHAKQISSLEVVPAQPNYDLLFLDSEPHLRFQELVKFYPYLKEGGYCLIHDLFGHLGQEDVINPDHPDIPHWPFGTLPDEIKEWLKTDKLRVIPLPAPRGLVMLYKTKPSDYAPK